MESGRASKPASERVGDSVGRACAARSSVGERERGHVLLGDPGALRGLAREGVIALVGHAPTTEPDATSSFAHLVSRSVNEQFSEPGWNKIAPD